MTTITHPGISFAEKSMFDIWVQVGAKNECWEWTGQKNDHYGIWWMRDEKKTIHAHRMAWIIKHGAISDELYVDHTCHNKMCVNPFHLQAVKPKQNTENMKPVRAKSGFRGVHAHGKKWRATVRHNRKAHHSRQFDTPEEANEEAIKMRARLFTNSLTDLSDEQLLEFQTANAV